MVATSKEFPRLHRMLMACLKAANDERIVTTPTRVTIHKAGKQIHPGTFYDEIWLFNQHYPWAMGFYYPHVDHAKDIYNVQGWVTGIMLMVIAGINMRPKVKA